MARVRTLFRTLSTLSSLSSSVASIQVCPTPNSCTSCLSQIHFSSKSDPLPLHSTIYCLLCPVCLVPQDVGRTPRPRFPLAQRTWKGGARLSPEGWARVPKTWGAALGPSTAAVALSSEGFFLFIYYFYHRGGVADLAPWQRGRGSFEYPNIREPRASGAAAR